MCGHLTQQTYFSPGTESFIFFSPRNIIANHSPTLVTFSFRVLHRVKLMTKVHIVDINGVSPQARMQNLPACSQDRWTNVPGSYRWCQVHTTQIIREIHIVLYNDGVFSQSVSAVWHVFQTLPPPGAVPLPHYQPDVDWSCSRTHCRINLWQERSEHILSASTNNPSNRLN